MVYVFYSNLLPEWYNEELAKHPNNLTQNDQLDIARKIQNLIKNNKMDTPEFENVANELFLPKKNYAAAYVMKNRFSVVPVLDQVLRGTEGLYKAILTFNPEISDCLDAYAAFPIRNGIREAFLDYRKGLSASRTTLATAVKFRKHWKYQNKINKQEMPIEYVAKDFGVSTWVAERYMRLLNYREISSSQQLSDDDVRTIEDSLVDENLLEEVDKRRLKDLIYEVKRLRSDVLNDNEQEAINLRFGLEGNEEHTLDQAKVKMGISHERVRQLEAQALKKLRLECLKNGISLAY
ncbi:hypothetical protein KY334_05270 [Candidatus Woesearchaeota archaeon]|nr:hypothetical protein [Candidatus Woesearchaeota archaeon]